MTSRSEAFLQLYPVGTVVRVAHITGHQAFTSSPIVVFPPIGRRSVFKKVFSNPQSDFAVVRDEAEITGWRAEVNATAERAAKRKAKMKAKAALASQ